ncbi:Cell division protein FtsZ [Candidatus Terasakiella magnetica]|uniref:Cell division protein FtsZ n=1 Tax=Candidatus Terasakiella magnetica TaxID=1867952 RepID=A0A1C3RJD7_9PROT|nr:cell division protein FtsZ [Candidatus Terasakiella magnetica]SCA57404.1 Cell division protein FtsZ [Candidatus Terasakiella magnetica]
MAINFQAPEHQPVPVQTGPRISVIGVGGAGGNAVNNMIQSSLEGVEFVVANTDAQALTQSKSDHRIQLGAQLTSGLGAGSKPDVGRDAALESIDDIMQQITGSNMVFITAGMGGGTGTGAAPVIAHAAREAGILTVGVVTKPFQFEGVHRMRLAEAGIEEMQKYVDTLIVIPNQNLFRIATENTTFAEAFQMADEVLHSGVRGVTDLMVRPGMINLDFSDIKTVMMEMGKAMMGTGEAEGERRATEAAEAAISNPLLDDSTMKGAKGVLINITGGMDISLFEVDEAANRIREEVDADANIIFGTTLDETLEGKMRVSVVSTGIDAMEAKQPTPRVLDAAPEITKPQMAPQPTPAPAAEQAPTMAQNVASRVLSMQSVAQPQQPVAQAEPVAQAAQAVQENPATSAEQVAKRIQNSLREPQEVQAVQQERAPFIPPAATQVSQPEEPVTAPNPFAQKLEEVVEETVVEEEPAATPSLFGRITGRVARAAKAKETAEIHEMSQPSLDISPADRPVTSQHAGEDDLLDIPAFLRRQAN